MKDDPILVELVGLGVELLGVIRAKFPSGDKERFALWMEMLRVLDYWTVFQEILPDKRRLTRPDFELMRWGWNLAVVELLRPLPPPRAIPILESTPASREFATTVLHNFGRVVLLRRAADMVRTGHMTVERAEGGFVFRQISGTTSQHADYLEFARLTRLEREIEKHDSATLRGWTLVRANEQDAIASRPGSFFARRTPDRVTELANTDLDALMLPLIRPWDSGHGVMLGYGATPAVDDHFLGQGLELAMKWRNELGLPPESQFGSSTSGDVVEVAAFLIALHLKHIRFALLSAKHHPTISIPQSFTIWETRDQLVEVISDFFAWPVSRVEHALAAVTLHAGEAPLVAEHSWFFMPLLVDLGNGFLLRPISSLSRNPLVVSNSLLAWRDAGSMTKIMSHREAWQRSEIYAMFQGARYQCVAGNIRLKKGGREITDVDAAIFDRTTGEVALMQLKWQDYFTNDVRKLRSKSSNLSRELERWTTQVTEWVRSEGLRGVASALRLNQARDGPVREVHLFAISREVARVGAYGWSPPPSHLAIANWPQFARVRFQLGPVAHVLREMHERFCSEATKTVIGTPVPMETTVLGRSLRFEDLWCDYAS